MGREGGYLHIFQIGMLHPRQPLKLGSESHQEPRLQTNTIYMGENFLKSSVQFETVRRPL